eukprot:TRINITY_DN14647_c0_g1_i2.p1 TRINITY_DN14647_c0_g1~~TRINITY_DN14647_c0_g1_i2.p1  ORF type:complete len:101 (-),score=22.48 TRINITY_DN14647_c0_g1_i2:77-379(-)
MMELPDHPPNVVTRESTCKETSETKGNSDKRWQKKKKKSFTNLLLLLLRLLQHNRPPQKYFRDHPTCANTSHLMSEISFHIPNTNGIHKRYNKYDYIQKF